MIHRVLHQAMRYVSVRSYESKVFCSNSTVISCWRT